MVELVDTTDLKSVAQWSVRVRVPLWPLTRKSRMKIKAGTLCYISMPGKGNTIRPVFDGTGKSFFSVEQEVEVVDIGCENKNLIAVYAKANDIEDLIAGEGIETVVWINKNNLKQVVK